MHMYSDKEIEFSLLEDKPIDIGSIVMKYVSNWKWFLLSLGITLLLGLIYIIYTNPSYRVETSILFKDDTRGGASELNVLKDMGLITRRSNVDNEVEVLKKTLIVEQVVRELNIYTSYLEKKQISLYEHIGLENILPSFITKKKTYLYDKESPILITVSDSILSSINKPIKLKAEIKTNGEVIFIGRHNKQDFKTQIAPSDTTVILPFGAIKVLRNQVNSNSNRKIDIAIHNPLDVASIFQKAIKIELTSKTSSVANISFISPNENLGKEFLNEYISAYNQKGINDQIELADKTSRVIEEHLSLLSGELSSVESQAQDYRQSKGLTNISSQADIYSSQTANVRQKLMDVESQLGIISSLNNIVQDMNDHTQLIPSNSGINSSSLINQIEQYNQYVLEKNRLSRIASSSNQSMIDLNNKLESTFSSVRNGLQNEKRNLEIQQDDIQSMLSQNYARIRAIPQQEREYSDIVRQQSVKEALFVYLLQKKEEKYMNMASVMPNSKLIDSIYIKGLANPNIQLVLILAIGLGLVVPFAIIALKDLFKYHITNKKELEEFSTIPVLGEIPLYKDKSNPISVEEDNNNNFNEMIRLLRTNLLFVINGKENKVINMLSSISGEGKTFLTINLSKSLALLDKKVVIVELDIRKPKLSKLLNLDNSKGVTLYLAGSQNSDEIIQPSNIHRNVSIIACGSIPPNPNELLSKPALDELIRELRHKFDFIIIDSAPLGVVSDSFLLDRITDINLYVIKARSTHKRFIEEAEQNFKNKRLKKMYFVLNNVDMDKIRYGYGYKYEYGSY